MSNSSGSHHDMDTSLVAGCIPDSLLGSRPRSSMIRRHNLHHRSLNNRWNILISFLRLLLVRNWNHQFQFNDSYRILWLVCIACSIRVSTMTTDPNNCSHRGLGPNLTRFLASLSGHQCWLHSSRPPVSLESVLRQQTIQRMPFNGVATQFFMDTWERSHKIKIYVISCSRM